MAIAAPVTIQATVTEHSVTDATLAARQRNPATAAIRRSRSVMKLVRTRNIAFPLWRSLSYRACISPKLIDGLRGHTSLTEPCSRPGDLGRLDPGGQRSKPRGLGEGPIRAGLAHQFSDRSHRSRQ